MILDKRDVSWYANFTKKQGGICWHSKLAWPKVGKINAKIANSILTLIILQVGIYDHCAGYRDRFGIFWIWFHQWDKDGHKKASRWGQIMGFNAPKWRPRRDDRNGHMDRLIRSPSVGVMAPGSSPIWAKPVWPDLGTGLTGFGCCAARGVRSDRIWWPVWPVFSRLVRIRVVIWF